EFAEVDEHDVLRLEYHVPKSGGEFKVPIALSHDGHECVLKGYAFRRVEPNKSLLSLGYLQESQPATQAVTFVSPYETDFRWRPDRTRHSEYVQLKQIADGPRSTLEVTLLAPSLPGTYNETLELAFEIDNDQDLEEVPLELYGYVLD